MSEFCEPPLKNKGPQIHILSWKEEEHALSVDNNGSVLKVITVLSGLLCDSPVSYIKSGIR